MSYYNQMDHRLLDRKSIKDLLMNLSTSAAQISPLAVPRSEHWQHLRNLCQSDLERYWLDYLAQNQYNLPSHAQKLIETCQTRPDFLYEKEHVAIYVDGYHHLFPDRQKRDQAQQNCLEDQGFIVLRFGLMDEWEQIIQQHTYLFGNKKTA